MISVHSPRARFAAVLPSCRRRIEPQLTAATVATFPSAILTTGEGTVAAPAFVATPAFGAAPAFGAPQPPS